jgi:hypothetical protein
VALWRWCRKSGYHLAVIRINAKKILFDAADVCTWLQELKSTAATPRVTIEVAPRRRRSVQG